VEDIEGITDARKEGNTGWSDKKGCVVKKRIDLKEQEER